MSDLLKTTFSSQIFNKYILWFESSKRWLLLEEPAYFVYSAYSKKTQLKEIATQCKDRYGLSSDESTRFIQEIIDALLQHQTALADYPDFEPNEDWAVVPDHFQFSCTYTIFKHNIHISFSNSSIAYYLHPLLKHFETEAPGHPDIGFKLFKSENKLTLLKEGTDKGCWTFDDILKLKKQLFLEISGTIYGKERKDWMSIIHGSAVSNGKQSLVLAASSGSGKSTLAALLMKKGCRVMSDDFLPLCGSSEKIYPFPIPISVKKVALPILSKKFPKLPDNPYAFAEYATEYVHLLPIDSNTDNMFDPFPVRYVVFPKYHPDSKLSLKPLDQDHAIQYIIDNAIILPGMKNAKQFIAWFKSISFYTLQYSEPVKAANKLAQLISS
ncbi:MAG: hypothetical protein WD577_05975 [Bacteroidales bacterium]